MSVVFFGASKFVLPIINVLKNKFELVLVVTTEKLSTDPVPSYCAKNNIAYISVSDFSDSILKLKFINLKSIIAVLACFGLILPQEILNIFPKGILNIHPSLLPAFTGAYAYVKAFERGSQIVGCTAHFVTEELDEGPIIWQDSFRVEMNEDLESIKRKGRQLEARTLLRAVELYLKKKLSVYWGKVHFG